VVLAATFAERNNYQRRGGYRDDLLAIMRTTFNGRNLLKSNRNRERFLVDAYFRECIFPHTGWAVTSAKVHSYRREKEGQNMMFFCYRLQICEPNEAVRWPLVEGAYPGFPTESEGDWVTSHVIDLK